MTPAQRDEFDATHECNFAIAEPDVGRSRVAFNELIPRLGHDDRLGGLPLVRRLYDVGNQLVPPTTMPGLALIVVEPRFIVDHLGCRPLRRVSPSLPSRWRGVGTDDAVVGVFIVNQLPQVSPEVESQAAVVVHVVLARQHPDDVVCAQAMHHVAAPASDVLFADRLLHVRI